MLERNMEGHLGRRGHPAVHPPGDKIAQQALAGFAADFRVFGKRGEQFDKWVVEEGYAVFHRVRHAQPILLEIDVRGQPFPVLKRQHPVGDRAPRGLTGERLDLLGSEPREKVARVELPQFRRPIEGEQQVVAIPHGRAGQCFQQHGESFTRFAGHTERNAGQMVDQPQRQRTHERGSDPAHQPPGYPVRPFFGLDDRAQILVAAEGLVRAVAGHDNLDAGVAGRARQNVLRDHHGITDRFFERGDNLGHAQDIFRAAKYARVFGPQAARGGLRARRLARAPLEVDTEGFHRTTRQSDHLADQSRRIDAPAQVGADFDVGDHVALHRRRKRLVEQCLVIPTVVGFGAVVRRRIIAMQRSRAVLPGQIGTLRQPVNPLENGLVTVGETGAQIEIDRTRTGRHAMAGREDRADLGREVASPFTQAVIAGLDAEAVAHKIEGTLAAIVEGENEHAAQTRQHLHAVLLVEVDQGFGIRVGPENMPAGHQLGSELPVVVDFTVEDHHNRFVFVE